MGGIVALGAQPTGVKSLVFNPDLPGFDLTRQGMAVTADRPLQTQAWIGFVRDLAGVMKIEKSSAQSAGKTVRSVEAPAPAPVLGQAPPAAKWGVGIEPTADGWTVNAGDFRVGVGNQDGALRSWETDSGQWLSAPGGVNYAVWPNQQRFGPGGALSNARPTDNGLDFDWSAGSLTAHHRLEPRQGYIVWEVRIPNPGNDNLLLETRLSLPARLGAEQWHYWDGLSLRSLDAKAPAAETTTLVPGRRLSQGIFPAVSLHNAKISMVAGLFPTDIESFYGSRVKPAGDPLETFYYVVRMAIPPRQERSVKFLLYAADPNWSWRSVVDRYWSFWPALFAAPPRDDVWGFYGLAQPTEVNSNGDKFIDLCRRMRVGAMELPMPFAKGGDFYAPTEPAYARKFGTLNREQLRQVYQISNIACCTLSYLIPMRCERQMAFAQYADSIIHRDTGEPFLSDSWELMPKGVERLAAMFAWGDSFGEHVRQDLRRIVADYKPDGLYLDLGAYLIEDYGRMTEWSAFTDQGKMYTNAGIAYAKLLEDIASFAPQVQRNPGELIQYFEGFQGNAHLSNHTSDQPFYIRTHRLIMGRKPIYTGLTTIMTQTLIHDSLEFGGLPVLAFHFDRKW
ncbi:MAG: hypothetical protein NTW86_07355 [Candidatus Sumerlaeota bacterium]|nr:hypothetical protein [Candidatus Sumerlaeota bacterium]